MDRHSAAWASSGAMALTGRSDGPPLGVPRAVIDLIERAAARLNLRSDEPVDSAGLALLGERAAIGGLTRRGDVSVGGGTRLLRGKDGWLAVALARTDDVDALAAWLEAERPDGDPWPWLADQVARHSVTHLDARAALLGLPFAAVDSVAPPEHPAFDLPIGASHWREADPPGGSLAEVIVIDLSTLWAGPLCGQLLAEAGATVVKVESMARPDGARRGPAPFFDLLNGAKRSVALNLDAPAGRQSLRRLLESADVVIESARPRALEHWGLLAEEFLRGPTGPRVWASITSHGRGDGARQRVGFGDVAAAAGGLVVHDERGPCFVADAVTDPMSGLVAAAGVLEALATGGRWLLDVAMAPLAASVAGDPFTINDLVAAEPRARPGSGAAPALGADTARVLARLAS